MSWYKNSKHDLRILFNKMYKTTFRDQFLIEKDFVQTLILAELAKSNFNFVFKGGTSLSRAHCVLDRFSEDLDVTLFLEPSRGVKKDIIFFLIDLSEKLNLNLDNRIDLVKDSLDVNKFYFNYDSVFIDRPNELLLELSTIKKSFPIERKKITGIVDQYLITHTSEDTGIILPSFYMNVQSMERTLIDKVFALCDAYLERKNKPYKSYQAARHLYDIAKILPYINYKEEKFDVLINQVRLDLFENFIDSKYKHSQSADPDVYIPETIYDFVKDRYFEKGYNWSAPKLHFDKTTYTEAVNSGILKIAKNGFPRTLLDPKKIEVTTVSEVIGNIRREGFANQDTLNTIKHLKFNVKTNEGSEYLNDKLSKRPVNNFSNYEDLKKYCDNPKNDLSKVQLSEDLTVLDNLFMDSERTEEQFQGIENWNVSKVESMEGMFEHCAINADLNKWDVSSVKNMKRMFAETPYFNQPLNHWNVSMVEDMEEMFYHSAFKQRLNSWQISEKTNIEGFFGGHDPSIPNENGPEIVNESEIKRSREFTIEKHKKSTIKK